MLWKMCTTRCKTVTLLLVIFCCTSTLGDDGVTGPSSIVSTLTTILSPVSTVSNTSSESTTSSSTGSKTSLSSSAPSPVSSVESKTLVSTEPTTSSSTSSKTSLSSSVSSPVSSIESKTLVSTEPTTLLSTDSTTSLSSSGSAPVSSKESRSVVSNTSAESTTSISVTSTESSTLSTVSPTGSKTSISNPVESTTLSVSATGSDTSLESNTSPAVFSPNSTVSSNSTSTSPPKTDDKQPKENSNSTVPANEFSIFFINDLQYDIFPIHKDDGKICEKDEETANCIGGIGRLKHYIDSKRNNSNSLWLNTGNLLDEEWYKLLKYETAHAVAKILNFDYVTVGSKVFKHGREASETFLEELTPQILISNINVSNVRKSGDFKVGKCNVSVIGFVDDSELVHNLHEVNLSNATESIIKEIRETQSKQQDASKLLTIVLGSTNRAKANEIANFINGIDFLLYSGGCDSKSNNSSDHFCWDTVARAGKQAYVWSLNMNHNNLNERFLVGEVHIILTDDCKVRNITHSSYDYSEHETDSNTTEMIRAISKLPKLNQNLTENLKNLTGDSNKCRRSECSLGNLFADSMIATLRNNDFWSANASRVAIFPSVLFQENATVLQGNVTAAELYGLIAQDPYIYSVIFTGKELQEMLSISVNSIHNAKSNDFLHISGQMQILYNVTGNNCTTIIAINTVSASSDSMALSTIDLQDQQQFYKVAMPYSVFTMDSYKKILSAVNETRISFHDMTVIQAVVKNINNTQFLSLPVVGSRQIQLESHVPPPEIECASHTGTTILVTLVLTLIFLGACYGVWWYVFKRRRGRSGSTMAMINLD